MARGSDQSTIRVSASRNDHIEKYRLPGIVPDGYWESTANGLANCNHSDLSGFTGWQQVKAVTKERSNSRFSRYGGFSRWSG
jgi:hypothetical protein